MKEELKIEHLAPYLPYGLKVINIRGSVFLLNTFSNMRGSGIESRDINSVLSEQMKPILRPLSDLTKEIEHNGKKFVPLQYLSINIYWYNLEQWKSDHKLMNVEEYNNLLSWHFDVFGLIDQNLAIDINTLNK